LYLVRVFIDADKKSYKDYLLDLLGYDHDPQLVGSEFPYKRNNDCLLEENAVVFVDNTLWKGLVLEQVSAPEDTISSPIINQ